MRCSPVKRERPVAAPAAFLRRRMIIGQRISQDVHSLNER